jgi:hypothetical protein
MESLFRSAGYPAEVQKIVSLLDAGREIYVAEFSVRA